MKKIIISLAICLLATLGYGQTKTSKKLDSKRVVITETVATTDTLSAKEIDEKIKTLKEYIKIKKDAKIQIDIDVAKYEATIKELETAKSKLN